MLRKSWHDPSGYSMFPAQAQENRHTSEKGPFPLAASVMHAACKGLMVGL